MADRGHERFRDLRFSDFAARATDPELSMYEKIGFPDEYRRGSEEAIFADIVAKLPALADRGRRVIDIGPGCSELPRMIDRRCREAGHALTFIDHAEMLAHHPPRPGLELCAGRFPDCPELLERDAGRADAVIAYSLLHIVFADAGVFAFLDAALTLLAPGGALLLGDIPNVSKRRRFFSSAAGIAHHRAFTGGAEPPEVTFNRLEPGLIDDAIVTGLVMRARAAGFDAYVVPQPPALPMANRREDILVVRP